MFYVLSVPGAVEEVEEVRVLEWHGQAGQAFAPGELVVELETHKALVEVRAGQAGVLRRVLTQEGDWQAVGQPLALLSDAADEPEPAATGDLSMLEVSFEVS